MSRAILDFFESPDSVFNDEPFYTPDFEVSVPSIVTNFYVSENILFLSPTRLVNMISGEAKNLKDINFVFSYTK